MIKVTGYRVLIKSDVEKTITDVDGMKKHESGLFIPKESNFVKEEERAARAPDFGTVVSIGPTAWKAFDDGHAWAQVGDKVAFAKYGGMIMTDPSDGEEYIILNDKDILAVIEV